MLRLVNSLRAFLDQTTKINYSDEKEVAEAQAVRDKEQATFAASEEELTGDIDTLEHAIGILKKELAKSSRAFAQDDAKGCLQWWRPQEVCQ